MLQELTVRNLGIIEDLSWRPGAGLNVITGETGAGKSLIIDAVELVLGDRAGEDVIRHGADQASVEAVFSLPPSARSGPLRDILAQKGLESDDDTLVISCELRRHGSAVTRVNGHAVPRNLLRQVGRRLVDIHGQSEHLSLLDNRSHLDYLDAYAHTTELRDEFNARTVELGKAQQELRALATDEKERARREEYLLYQVNEIKQAKLAQDEEKEMERERNVLSSAEQLKATSYEAYSILYESDDARQQPSALNRLNEAARAVRRLVDIDPDLSPQLEALEQSVSNLTEAARDIHAYSERLEHDPARLEQIETRLELIRGLKRKYGQSITEILDFLQSAEDELARVGGSAERRSELESEVAQLKSNMGGLADRLSRERSEAAGKLIAEVKRELGDLNMSGVGFEVAISRQPAPDGIPLPDGKSYAPCDGGIDQVEFMAATNPGEPLKPLAKIASTGEISRFTLALKGALSATDNIPVLIFDEIDIGIGGRSGDIIGRKLCLLARGRQVVCITHLPQIAAFADAHFAVHKEVTGARTLSLLEGLDDESSLRELAVMLAGPSYTGNALESARELRRNAESWKKDNIPASAGTRRKTR